MKKTIVIHAFIGFLICGLFASCGSQSLPESFTQTDTAYTFKAYGMQLQLPWNPYAYSSDLQRYANDSSFGGEPRTISIARDFGPEQVRIAVTAGKYKSSPYALGTWFDDMKKIKTQYGVEDVPFEKSYPASVDSIEKLIIKGTFTKANRQFDVRAEYMHQGLFMWQIQTIYPQGNADIAAAVDRIFNSVTFN